MPTNGLRIFAKILCLSTVFLIFAGGMVTSTGSGLAVPDWPLSYGMVFPPMVGGVFYEHGHRLIAASVGFLTLVMAVWLFFSPVPGLLKKWGAFALFAVIAQGVLGGMTVLFQLPTAISVSHAVMGQTFFCVTIVIAYLLSKENSDRAHMEIETQSKVLTRAAIFLVGAIYVQLILGALMRHLHAGLAVYDFPTMAGAWWPALNQGMLDRINTWRAENSLVPVSFGQVFAHLLHRAGAVLVLAAVFNLNQKIKSAMDSIAQRVRSLVFSINALVGMQIGLGAFVIWTGKAAMVASAHVAVGASILGISVLLLLKTLPAKKIVSIATQQNRDTRSLTPEMQGT